MRNLTFKAAMLKGSQPTVNRQSTDGQSQRHCKQTPLSKRWKVLMTLVFLFTFAIGNVWADITWTAPQSSDAVAYQQTMSDGLSKFHNKNSATSTSTTTPEQKTDKWSIKTNNSGGFWIIPNEAITKVTINYLCTSTNSGDIAYKVQSSDYGNNTSGASTATFAVKSTGNKNIWFDAELSISVAKDQHLYVKFPTNVYISYIALTTSGGGCTANPAAPTKFEAGSITEDGVTFSITDAANAGKYDIYYSTSNTAPEATTAASATSTANSKAITGLTASTKYYAWVRSVCDDSHKSAWVALTGDFFTTAAPDPCTTHHWFVATADATANGKTNWDGFTNAPTGSNGQNNSITIDGSNYTLTKRTGSTGEGGTILGFTIPANKAGTLYGYMKSSGTGARTLSLKKGDDVVKTNTEITDGNWTLITISAIAPGTYTLSPDKNVQIQMFALKVCDAEFHTITFDADGGSTVASISALDGAPATKPADPTKENADFVKWVVKSTGNDYEWTSNVTGDLTLKAVWSQWPKLTLEAGEGATGDAVVTYHKAGSSVAVPAKPEGFSNGTSSFTGWVYSLDVEITDGAFPMPSSDLTLTAQWASATAVAQIVGGESYETFAAAIAAVTDGQTIQLLQDIDVDAQIEIAGVDITIDLNGHKIEYVGDATLPSGVILVHNGASLTINDSSDPDAGSIVSGDKAYAAVALTKLGDDASTPATLVVNGGALTGYYYGITGNGSRNNTVITINGGTITGTVGIAIYHPQVGTLTVNDGSLTGVDAAIEMRAGTLVINDGTFTATATEFSCNPNGSGSTTSGAAIAIAQHTTKKEISVTINGGTFNGVKALNESNPQVNDPAPEVAMEIKDGDFNGEVTTVDVNNFISGGTFDHEVAANQCAENYAPKDNGDGTYGVKPLATSIDFVAFIDANGTSGSWATYLSDHNYTISSTSDVSLDGGDNGAADKGLKIKKTGRTITFDVAAGKLVTLKVGSLDGGAQISKNGGEFVALTGANPLHTGASVKTYYYSADVANYVIKTTGDKYNIIQSVTIEDPYVVTFNANGGEEVAAATFYGTALTLPSATKGTEVFKGWYDAAEDGNLIGKASDSYTPTADVTLHAQWEVVSSDATLSALEVDGATVAGFDPETYIYNIVCEYGHTPEITLATATAGDLATVTINNTPVDEGTYKYVQVKVVPESGESDQKFYQVRYTNKPKYGVELIKATHNGTANGATVTGYIGGTVDKFTQNNGKLGSGAQSGDDPHHYFGIQLAEGTFKAGDMLVIKASALNGGNAATLYSDKGNTEIKIDGQFDTNSKMYVYTLEADVEKIYLYRQTSGCNPNVEYMAVYRLMAPFIEEFKIGEAVGTITGTNIAIEVPYAADLEHLTPAVKYWANGTAQISPAIGVTDFTDPVVFTVSSGYAEDATGAYAPVPYTVTVTKEAHYEAKIGETGYATLVAAVAAAQDGDEIVLQENVTNGAGVMLTKTDAKEITIDFGGYTYTAVSPAVGSAGTQNQAFHLEKGNTVTLKNGTITSSGSEIKMLIQNYCDLTLEDITLDGTGLEGSHRYVMSNNCGDVVIGDGTTITAKTGDVAFDVCATNYYPEGVTVTVKDGATISGIVEYDVWGTKPADNHAELAIEGGNFDVTWNVEDALAENAKDNLNVSGGTFTAAVPADYCAEGYAPTSWTVGTETKYGVHLAGVIRGAASTNSDGVYYYTLDNDVTIFSSESDGRLKTSNHIATSSDVVACGGDNGGYNVNKSAFVLQFPVNVKEFTIYGANSTERTISKVYVNATASTEIKIKNVGRELTGTYTNTKDEKCQTLTAVFAGENIISANDYVLINLSGSVNMYRILYTEAECTDPVINSTNATRAKVDETATVSVDATALGATYQWYRCEDALGTNPQIITGATAASYSFTKAAGDEYFKVVVGNNCNDVKVEAVVKAEVWTKLELADVTGNTSWSWAGVADDEVKINDVANKGLVLANYIDAPNFDKLEGHENARAYRSNDYPAYQGTSLKFHTTVAGAVIMDVRTGSGSFDLSVNGTVVGEITTTRSIQAMYVGAGDVLISATDGEFRIYNMEFKLDNDLEPARTDEWLAPGELGTVCIPQGAVAVGADIYELVGKEPQYGKIVFESVEHMKPGKPYLFQAKGTRIDFILTDEAEASEPDNSGAMKGTFVALNLTELENVYYFADHALWSCDDLTSLSVPANRAYVKMDEVQALQNPNAAPGRRRVVLGVHGEQVVTGVENLNASEQPIKLLINGQIFILRGEKMFDVTGKLVK